MEIGKLFYDITVDDHKLKAQLGDSDKAVKEFGENASSVGDKIRHGMNVAAGVLAGAGAGLTLYAKNATDYTVEYVKNTKALSRITGDSVEDSSRLLHVLDRVGISAEKAGVTFGVFSKKINEAANNTEANRLASEKLNIEIDKTKKELEATTKEIQVHGDKTGDLGLKVRDLNNKLATLQDQLNATANPLDQLGIKMQDANGKTKSFDKVLFEVADKFKGMPDGATKTALALDLFGRSGKDMIKVLNLGSDGIKELEKDADKLGLTLSQKNVADVAKFIRSQKDLKDSSDALKISIGLLTTPILADFNRHVNDMFHNFVLANPEIKSATSYVLAFGGPVATAASGALAFGANISQIGSASRGLLVAGGYIGALVAAVAGLGYAFFDMKKNVEEGKSATSDWSGKIASAVPFIGPLITQISTLAGEQQRAAYQTNQHKQALEEFKNATKAASDADFIKQGADLAVEAAQKRYNDTVAQFGPNSLEARQANYDLQNAEKQAGTAADNSAAAHHRAADAHNHVTGTANSAAGATNQAAAGHRNAGGAASANTGHIQGIGNAFSGAGGSANWAAGRMDSAANSSRNAGSGGSGAWSLARAWEGAADAISNAAQKAWNWIQKLNPFHRSSPSLVEYVSKGTKIITGHYQDMFSNIGGMSGGVISAPGIAGAAMATAGGGGGGNNSNYDFSGAQFSFANKQDVDYFFEKLDRDTFLSSEGVSPARGA